MEQQAAQAVSEVNDFNLRLASISNEESTCCPSGHAAVHGRSEQKAASRNA